jgi:hypothetical protein
MPSRLRAVENALNYWFGLNLGHDYENIIVMNSLPLSDVPDEMKAIVEYILDLIKHTLDIRPEYNETLWVGDVAKHEHELAFQRRGKCCRRSCCINVFRRSSYHELRIEELYNARSSTRY